MAWALAAFVSDHIVFLILMEDLHSSVAGQWGIDGAVVE
jgi:hypothetical protein